MPITFVQVPLLILFDPNINIPINPFQQQSVKGEYYELLHCRLSFQSQKHSAF